MNAPSPFSPASDPSIQVQPPAQAGAISPEDTQLSAGIAALQAGDFNERWDAVKQISNSGKAAIAPLLNLLQVSKTQADALEDQDDELAWFVARSLGAIQDTSVMPALIDLMQSTDSAEVATIAATALANFGAEAIAPLHQLLSSPDRRRLAVQALSQIHHADVIPALLSIVRDDDPQVRAEAIAALSQWNHPQILPTLIDAIKDPSAAIRQAAIAGLGFWATVAPEQADLGAEPEITSHIQPRLWDVSSAVSGQAAKTLGRIGNERAIAALAEGLQSDLPSVPLKIELVRALGWVGSLAALQQLQHYLECHQDRSLILLADDGSDPVLTICQEIIAVLGRVELAASRVKAAEILVQLLQSNHPIALETRGKQAIAQSLGQLQQVIAIDPLIQFLGDSQMTVRFHGIAALKQINHEVSQQRLIAQVADPTLSLELRDGMAIALQEWQA